LPKGNLFTVSVADYAGTFPIDEKNAYLDSAGIRFSGTAAPPESIGTSTAPAETPPLKSATVERFRTLYPRLDPQACFVAVQPSFCSS